MAAELTIIFRGQDEATPATKSVAEGLSSLNPAAEIATGALRRVGEIATDALGMAAQKVVAFAGDSIKAAGDFEQGMAGFANATGQTLADSGKSLDDFKQLFLSLGAELPVSTTEVEQAAIAMAQGGIDPATIAAGGLKDTIQFASAALKGDLVSAAEISAKTMQAWTSINDDAATKTEFMAHAQNLMAQATTAASTTVDQLFLGLSNVGGTARLAGASFDETVTALAQLTPAFSSSADAGTSFKTFLSRLQPETKPAIAAMTELGLYTKESGSAFYDANGKFVGMARAEELLHSATKNLTDAQRQQVLQTIFGNDAIRAAGVFANQGADGYAALADSIAKQSTVQQAAARNQATFNAALDNFKGSIEAVQITIGSALLPILTQLFNNTLAPAVNVVRDIANALLGSKEAFSALPPVIQPIVLGLHNMALVIGSLGFSGLFTIVEDGTSAFSSFLQVLGLSEAGARAVNTAIGGLISAAQPLISLIGANLQPILIAVAGVLAGALVVALASTVAAFLTIAAPIAAAIALGAALASAWQSNFAGVQTVVSSVMSAVASVIGAVLGQIAAFWQTHGSQILAFVSTTWSQIQGVIGTALALVQGIVVPVLTAIATFINQHGTQIQQYLGGAWQIITTLISTALSVIQGVLTAALQIIQGDWSGAWETIRATCASIVEGLIGILQGAVDMLAAGAQLGVDAIIGVWKAFTGWAGIGGSIIDGIASGIADAVGRLAQAAASAAKSALDAAKRALGIASPSAVMAEHVGSPIVDGIVAGIQSRSPKLTEQVVDLAQKVVSLISDAVGAFAELNTMGAVSVDAISRFVTTLNTVLTLFGEACQSWDKAMMAAAAQFAKQSADIVKTIKDGVDLLERLAGLPQVGQQAVDSFIASIVDLINRLVEVATVDMRRSMAAAVEFSATAGAIFKNLKDATSVLAGIADLGAPVAGSFLNFATQVRVLVGRMSEAAQLLGVDVVQLAVGFAAGAGKVLAIVKAGIEALTLLPTLGAPVPGMFLNFATQVRVLVGRMSEAAQTLGSGLVGEAAQFAESAAKVLAIVGAGIDALMKLPTLAAPTPGMFLNFATQVRVLVGRMSEAAQSLGSGAVQAAASFAEGAGKVLAIVASAIDSLTKLKDFQAPADAAIATFARTAQVITREMASVATIFTKETLANAALFAESAGKVLAIVGQGVDGLLKLKDFQSPASTAVASFVATVQVITAEMASAATIFTDDGLANATLFFDAAGKVLAIVGGAVDGLAKLVDFKAPAEKSVDLFVQAVQILTSKIAAGALTFSKDALIAAAAFADAAGKVISLLGGGVDSFAKLADLKDVAPKAIDLFVVALRYTLTAISTLAGAWSADALAQTTSFASAVLQVVKTISDAVDSFAKLSDFKGKASGIVTAFLAALRDLLAELSTRAVPASVDLGAQIMAGIAQGIKHGVSLVATAAQQAAQAALEAAKAALGIASPSVVFEQQVGKHIPTGIAQGVIGGTSTVVGAVRQVTGDAVRAGQTTPTTRTTTHYHNYQITGYNNGQVDNLTNTIRLRQRLQGAL
ncbi:MAG: phage tail tape measure protein [Kouleothrix sp.]|nr:phage tail tape measure protein [Kouleothrix sp.]